MRVNYFVAVNGITLLNIGNSTNYHEEADTLLIHCLQLCQNTSESAHVYANDKYINVLLFSHYKQTLHFNNKFIGVKPSVIDINHLYSILGPDRALVLMSFHCLTGCDTTGKFKGISKEAWTKSFLKSED